MVKNKLYVLLTAILLVVNNVYATPIREEGQKIASYLTLFAILVSLPAFISLYLHVRKTNLGHVFFQPFLAMFIGFFGIMLNSILDIWKVFEGHSIDNITMVMGVNRAISSVLIAVGCVVMFFSSKNKGLFDISYYQKKKVKKTTK